MRVPARRIVQLVVPARDEAVRLPRTLDLVREHVLASDRPAGWLEVIVVDNGSTDGTARLAAAAHEPAMPVRVVRCERRGKGAAVREGMRQTNADLVGFMDADGATHMRALEDALRILEAGADVAVGSRAMPGSITTERHSGARVQGARLYRRCTQQIVPGIADTQCGFKVFRGDLAREVFAELRTTGFSFDVEVLARARRRGARIVEFAVTWDDVPGSTFLPMVHGASTFWELALIARRLPHTRNVIGLPVPPVPADPGPLTAELSPIIEA